MRFRTRTFLLSFIPFVVLLAVSFTMIRGLVQSTVRNGLRASLRANHLSIARIRSRSDLQNSRFLKVVGENSALKAGMQLMLFEPEGIPARKTVEDQLTELCGLMGFDFLLVSAPDGRPLAGVVREGGELRPLETARMSSVPRGLLLLDNYAFEIASTPLSQANESIGSLSVGEYFNLSEFTTPAVLIHNGKVIQATIPNVPLRDVERALAGCAGSAECDVHLRSATYISLPVQGVSLGAGYTLRTLQNVDLAAGPVQAILGNVFAGVAIIVLLVALICNIASSSSIVKPIAALVAHLRETEHTGLLPEFDAQPSSIREIQDLMKSFHRAAVSVRDARENLQEAYIEFVGSLANALDARDPYTAGHSRRVSRLSCATALAMNFSPDEIQKIRIGALLHDIGKIGVSDHVLRKPDRLTAAEFALIRQRPEIGRRILEGVQGFTPYLPAVELHHENWDGTGYPHGQYGEQTPAEARIIHVSDAYDAMTTDRPYRKGMSHEHAIRILRANAGVQFDPRVVEAFTTLPAEVTGADEGVLDEPALAAQG